MRAFFIVLFFPCLIFAQPALPDSEKSQIQNVVKTYVEAFENKDFLKVQSLVTAHFLKITGGEKVWRTRLENLEGSSDSKATVGNLKIVSQNNKVYVRFEMGHQSPSGNWFLMKKNNDHWMFDEIINDFEPLE